MIGFSPRGVIDLVFVFPTMFIIALVLDILNIILSLTIIGGIILALIGFLTVGLWIIIRSGESKSPDRQKQESQPAKEGAETATKEGAETAAREGAETAAKTGTKVAAREGAEVAAKTAGKNILRVGIRIGAVTALKAIPGIGIISSIVFGWTIMVLWEAFSDLKNFSLEAGD